MKKLLTSLILLFGMGIAAAQAPVSHTFPALDTPNAFTNVNDFALLNDTVYVGYTLLATGTPTNISTATNYACLGHSTTPFIVSIPISYAGTDTIGAVTTGCGQVRLVDTRTLPQSCYTWNGTNYVSTACYPGTGSGVATVGVATANGFQGTSSGGSNPALTLNVDSSHYLPTTTDETNWNAFGSSSVFGRVKVDGTTITANGGVISAAGGGSGCAIGTCIVNNGTANQVVTEASGFGLGYAGTSWGLNPVFGNQADFIESNGNFLTNISDMGGGNGGNGAQLSNSVVNFDNPGFDWGYSVNNSWEWFTGFGSSVTNNMNAAGIGAASSHTIDHEGVGDSIGIAINDTVHGGYQALSDEGAVGIRNVVSEGGVSAGPINSGGTTGSTSLNVSMNQPFGVGRIIYDQTATTGNITTTQTLGGAVGPNNGVQIVNLGTTVTASTCGVLAGGPLVATTAYSITSNVITIVGTNSLYNEEEVTLSGYGTSTFLNGQSVFVIASTGTSFTATFTHANVSLTTEAGAYSTTNVDTPRQPNNNSISMTFGITLGSAYSGSSTALISMAGAGFIDTSRLSAVGSHTGGVQYVTAPLIHPILAGAIVCMGGLAGYGELNTTSPYGGYFTYIIGSPTTTSAYLSAVPAGVPSGFDYAKPGSVTLYPIASIQSFVPGSTQTVTLTPNSVAWANSDIVFIPNGIVAAYVSQENEIVNGNPYASFQGISSAYVGPAPFLATAMFKATVQIGGVNNLTSQGGAGFAPDLLQAQGPVGIGIDFTTGPPTDAFFSGNPLAPSLLLVQRCQLVTCATSYNIFTDDALGNSGGFLNYTIASNTFNFAGGGAGPATIQQNGVDVCLQNGTNCPTPPATLTGIRFANGASADTVATSPQIVTAANNSPSTTFAPALLPLFGTAVNGAVPLSGGGTTNFLRADGTWAAPAGGSGTVSDGSGTTTPGEAAISTSTAHVIGYSAAPAFAVTNMTGTGGFNTTGNAGSASAVALSGITGLGTGVATFLGTPSSANLLAALTTKTGTGNAVFSISPAFTGTPDASGATEFKMPVAASFATLANGEQGYDTTALNWHIWGNGVDNLNAIVPVSVAVTNNDCTEWSVISGVITLKDSGSGCGGGAGVSSWSGDGALYSNSGSTGAVTAALVTAAAHKFWGNNTASTTTPAYDLLGTNDWSPSAYVVGAGSVNVMTATLTPAATALTAGLQIDVIPNLANTTTTPTLNVSGLGAKTITKCGTTALAAGDYTTTAVAEFVYDGTRMQLLNPQAVACSNTPLIGGGSSIPTTNVSGPSNADIVEWGSTGALLDSFIKFSQIPFLSGPNDFATMTQGNVATVATATTVAPTTPFVIFSGTTTVTTITAPSGTAALIGAVFDMITSSSVLFNTGGNIATAFTTQPGLQYHCVFMGTTNGLWYCQDINSVLRGNITLTTATSDAITITGVTTASVCSFDATNSTAAGITTTLAGFYSVTANTFTLNHAATVAAGATYGVICTVD